uniref:Uncharacterized protein n=1 Tax=Setaria italica TaxID=4555 RepID=K3ZKY8_SETIT
MTNQEMCMHIVYACLCPSDHLLDSAFISSLLVLQFYFFLLLHHDLKSNCVTTTS